MRGADHANGHSSTHPEWAGPHGHDELPHAAEDLNINGYGVALRLIHGSAAGVSAASIKEMAGELVAEIAEECLRSGARAVGHIKSYLRADGGYIKADIVSVKRGAQVSGEITGPVRDARLAINSILVGLEGDEIARATLEVAGKILGARGFSVTVEKGEEV